MTKTFFACAGQGVQKPGMGWYLAWSDAAREVYEVASSVFGYDVWKLTQTASQDELNLTKNAQPALVTLEIAEAHALMAAGVEPEAVLGFSLGQISALEISGMLSLEDTFRLTLRRGMAMDRAAEKNPGCMAAVLKLSADDVEALCAEAAEGDVLVAANYNCPGQTVVSGTVEAVERLEKIASERKARVSRLATSGAFHSPLMAGASAELAEFLTTLTFNEPRIPLLANHTACPITAAEAPEALALHLTCPVFFQTSVEALAHDGYDRCVEVGPGGVLSGLVRRIDRSIERVAGADLLTA